MLGFQTRGNHGFAFPILFIASTFTATPTSAQCQFSWREGSAVPGTQNSVFSLTLWDPDGAGPQPELLVAGGSFRVAGNVTRNIAAWNGSSWIPFAQGLSNQVRALAVYQGSLIAAGTFTSTNPTINRIARWNGSSWEPLGAGLPATAYAMTVYNGELIVAGEFAAAGGNPANRIARWNGSTWQPLGSGIDGTVYALMVQGGELFAGGLFQNAGGNSAVALARWNGSNWSDVSGSVAPAFGQAQVKALTEYNGELVVAGYFAQAGGVAANNIAKWDGAAWHALGSGTDQMIESAAVFQNKLVVEGEFSMAGGIPNTRTIAVWDGAWMPFGVPFAQGILTSFGPFVTYQNELFIGHHVETGAGLVRYDGTTLRALGFGACGSIRAFTHYHDELIAAGAFALTDGGFSFRVARRVGNAWHPLGNAIRGDNASVVTVDALTVYDDELIAGGNFQSANGHPGNRVARWNGITWQPLGAGFDDGKVMALAVYDNALYAGGSFTLSDGVNVSRIARWSGEVWEPVAGGITPTNPSQFISAFTVFDGKLVAGGAFANAGGIPATSVARWDGTSWQAYGNGLNQVVRVGSPGTELEFAL